MNVLVFNCGSSSLKYKLLSMPDGRELAGGEAQRVGPPTAKPPVLIHRVDGREERREVPMPDHGKAFEQVMAALSSQTGLGVDVVGHRVVHGAAVFSDHAVVDDQVLADLEQTKALAPLHNPPAIALVEACRQRYPELAQVLVFDTGYHATIPPHARTYALPAWVRHELGIRKYGFHGTSHKFVVGEAARFLGKPLNTLNAVSCHLGSGGASLCAVLAGRSIDNTMGHSPLQGLVMSTRCGDLDPAVVLRLLAGRAGDTAAVEKLLNKTSGVLGLSGNTADIRDVAANLADPKEQAQTQTMSRAWEVYIWRVRKYLGAYLTVVAARAGRRADAVIFTDTIGETMPLARWAICSGLEALGLEIDPTRNAAAQELPADVASEASPVRILAIATNEELAIAKTSYDVMIGNDEQVPQGGAA